MKITVNGQTRDIPDGATVFTLLEDIGIRPELVAVEKNKEILPKSQYGEPLAEGDCLEIVHFVGGG